MKKILFIILIIVLVVIINFAFLDNKIYYLNLNTNENEDYSTYYKDYLEERKNLEYYNNNFIVENYRITDLIHFIEDNEEVQVGKKNQTIQNAIIKADIITVWTGMNELKYKMNTADISELYNYVDTMLMDMERLFLLLRTYSKEKIIFLNFYNPNNTLYNEVIIYANTKLNNIALEYNIDIVDVSHIINQTVTEQNKKEIASILEEI